jgi:hypothetical protein
MMSRPALPEGSNDVVPSEIALDLVIDSAGKVRSAKPVGAPDPELIKSTAGWKFIPAYKLDKPVASHFRIITMPYQ